MSDSTSQATMIVTRFWMEPERWKDEDGPTVTKVMKLQLTAVPASGVRNMAEVPGDGGGQTYEFAMHIGGAAALGQLLLRSSGLWGHVPDQP